MLKWANVIMSLERTVPPNKAKDYLEAYSIKLSATERGVMVIKKKDKTRASQRKGALSNWKVQFNYEFPSCHFVTRRIILLILSTNRYPFSENWKNDYKVLKEKENDWR